VAILVGSAVGRFLGRFNSSARLGLSGVRGPTAQRNLLVSEIHDPIELQAHFLTMQNTHKFHHYDQWAYLRSIALLAGLRSTLRTVKRWRRVFARAIDDKARGHWHILRKTYAKRGVRR
jgi:hypothetical protein